MVNLPLDCRVPILEAQSRDHGEFSGIVGDKCGLLTEGVGRDQGVERANERTSLL